MQQVVDIIKGMVLQPDQINASTHFLSLKIKIESYENLSNSKWVTANSQLEAEVKLKLLLDLGAF